jgi:hypothetical protein
MSTIRIPGAFSLLGSGSLAKALVMILCDFVAHCKEGKRQRVYDGKLKRVA